MPLTAKRQNRQEIGKNAMIFQNAFQTTPSSIFFIQKSSENKEGFDSLFE